MSFLPPVPVWVVALLVAALATAAVLSYLRTSGEFSRSSRAVMLGLRVAAVAALGLALARPVLSIAESITQRNVVAVVVDDSRSMRIADIDGAPRSTVVNGLVGSADSALIRSLSDRYQVRLYRVSGSGKVQDATALDYNGSRSRLTSALLRVGDELAGTPVAGMVLVSDGADNSSSVPGEPPIADQLASIRARGVPVFTVGVGSPRFDRDIEISRIEAPREALKNATLLVNVVIAQRGFGGARLPVVVEDSGRIVGSTTAVMPRDGEAMQVRVRVPATEVGARLLRVHVPAQQGELLAENNERHTVVIVRDSREKVLHVEGEPRFEIAFLRRAVEGDPNLQLVTLLRSAKDKYLRLGVDDSLDLASGFPKTRDELFGYRGIVLGSVEASFFTGDQIKMLSEFVSERGGGLMLLGGRRSYGEGGYGGTLLADAVPVEFSSRQADTATATEILARPTVTGALHPAVQIGPDESRSMTRWDSMPPLTTVNSWLRAKPGATVLLEGRRLEGGPPRPFLVFQRFGRGRVMAFAAQDSWLWQMHASVAVTDSTYEVFWRQMLRWLVSEVPDRVEAHTAQEAARGEAIPVRATVSDSTFVKANGAEVTGVATSPSGAASQFTMDWAVDRDGEYVASYVPDEAGVHSIRLQAVIEGDTLRSPPSFVRVAEPTEEYFGAEMQPSLLRQLGEETGGGYYGSANAANIASDLRYSPSGATVIRRNDLWDMPLIFLVLLLALGGEWLVRRRSGLA
ncbi:MAG: glutamine amidotransferase [Gemmatimonadota bacterium]